MTYGLRNAGQTFQRYINRALGDLDFVFAYIDDILIASANLEEHENHLRIVFQRLKEFSLRLKLDKCIFGQTELEFLGHLINRDGFKPIPEKVQVITQFPKPRTVSELRRFLGLANFYRRSLRHASSVQKPLHQYLRDTRKNDKREIVWTPEAEEAFHKVKENLSNAILLYHPSADAETRLATDASDTGMGATLEQQLDNSWKPLAFFSRKFNSTQTKYSTYDRELTAVYESIKHFRHFLEGRDFGVVTDHKPLIYPFMQRSERASPRQQRQLSYISQFTTRIAYIPGSENVGADSLSRINALRLAAEIDLNELAEGQSADDELKSIRESSESSLSLKQMLLGPSHTSLYCDLTGEAIRPYIPACFRKRVFDMFHNPAHPCARVTDRVIRKRYVWPNMHRDILPNGARPVWTASSPKSRAILSSIQHKSSLPMPDLSTYTWILSVHYQILTVIGIVSQSLIVSLDGQKQYR